MILTISIIFLTLGLLLLAVLATLIVKWDVVDMINVITGNKSKKAIKGYKKANEVVSEKELDNSTTETLLSKSYKKGSMNNIKSIEGTISKINKSTKIGFNLPNIALTGRSKPLNSKNNKTEESKANPIAEQSEYDNFDFTTGESSNQHNKNQSNNISSRVSVESKENSARKESVVSTPYVSSDRTTILTSENDNYEKTSILSDSEVDLEERIRVVENDNSNNNSENRTQLLVDEVEKHSNEVEEFSDKDVQLVDRNDGSTNGTVLLSDEDDYSENKTSLLIDGNESNVYDTDIDENKTSILTDEDEEEMNEDNFYENKTSILSEWGETTDSDGSGMGEGKISVSATPKQTVINITGVEGDLEEPVAEENNSGKTQIIGEYQTSDYKRVLSENKETLEFHDYRVVEVVTSYGVSSRI